MTEGVINNHILTPELQPIRCKKKCTDLTGEISPKKKKNQTSHASWKQALKLTYFTLENKKNSFMNLRPGYC